MSDKNTAQPSTLQSYVDSATGAIQSAIGSLTGNTGDEAKGNAKQNKAEVENDASHATMKLPGISASSSGAVTRDDPNRTQGSWNQTVGSAKEAVGGFVGSQDLKESGRQQNLSGREQEARGQVNDWTSGAADRAAGTVGAAVSGLTGNKGAENEYQRQHDVGKTQQRGAEYDIQKQADAENRH